MTEGKIFQINGFILKLIAVITMFIDHFGVVFVRKWAILNGCEHVASWDCKYSIIYELFRSIGRMAFPIYVFLLIEGFAKTSNRKRYALRLFVFAIISEVPFDLAFHKQWYYLEYNNVMWTLLIGLITIWIIEKVQNSKFPLFQDYHKVQLATLFITIIGMGVATVAHVDYKYLGIVAIVIMYLFYNNKGLGFALAVGVMGIVSPLEFFALLETPLIVNYNGKRGYSSKCLKYLFYSFYAAHLLLLWYLANIYFN